ncbi:hypothetical protein HK100_001274 [Physocladia obscura]|uniref:Manganese lipoxygenase n=1 Tax=Physocladia obscura TaxID=109957 RepID=A0AAD5SX75_9FUNG|nr:hypothetical protein HK100_001274 [Physocladia obscura]
METIKSLVVEVGRFGRKARSSFSVGSPRSATNPKANSSSSSNSAISTDNDPNHTNTNANANSKDITKGDNNTPYPQYPALIALTNRGLLPLDNLDAAVAVAADAFNVDVTANAKSHLHYPSSFSGSYVFLPPELALKSISLADFISASNDEKFVTADELLELRLRYYKSARKSNPHLVFGSKELAVLAVESVLFLNVFGENDRIPIDFIAAFLVNEQIPSNYKKPKKQIARTAVNAHVIHYMAKWEWASLFPSTSTIYPIDTRNFDLISVSSPTELILTPANEKNLDSCIPDIWHGVFFIDNKHIVGRDSAGFNTFSLANGIWHSAEQALYLSTYDIGSWSFNQTESNKKLYNKLKSLQIHYKITFDPITHTAIFQLVYGVDTGNLTLDDIPIGLTVFTVSPNSENIFSKVEHFESTSRGETRIFRIVDAAGNKTPEFQSVYLKECKGPQYFVSQNNAEISDVGDSYRVEINTDRTYQGTNFADFKITVLTSLENDANSTVLQTLPLKLKNLPHSIFDFTLSKKAYNTFLVDDPTFKISGTVYAITITASGIFDGIAPVKEWYVDAVKISKPGGASGDAVFHFPVYDWLTEFTSTNMSNLPYVIQQIRQSDLNLMRSIYVPKALIAGLPVGMGNSPKEIPRNELDDDNLGYDILRDLSHVGFLKDLMSVQIDFKSIPDIDNVYKFFKKPEIADVWYKDSVFGRQLVTGCNPVMIRAIPPNPSQFPPESLFKISRDKLTQVPILQAVVIGNKKSLDDLVSEGRFSIVDFRKQLTPFVKLLNISIGNGMPIGGSLVAPVALIYHDVEHSEIYPVAIQLDEHGNVFYPPSHDNDGTVEDKGTRKSWDLVKMFFSLADSHIHELLTHFLRTHLCIEPFAIAMNRQMHATHPIFKLLKTYFNGTMFINAEAREVLLQIVSQIFSIGDNMDDFFAFNYNLWRFSDWNPMKDLESRGFDGVSIEYSTLNNPGEYPWAEDARDLFSVISKHVHEYISIFYQSDQSVEADKELNAWIAESANYHGDKGVPVSFPTKNSLAECLSMIIWTAAPQHSSVGYTQFNYYSFPLNRPLKTQMMPLQNVIPDATDDTLVKFLPPRTEFITALNIFKAVGSYSQTEVYLGQRSENLFGPNENKAQGEFDRFKLDLGALDERIQQRNAALPGRKAEPYLSLLSTKIVSSIKR